jgi:undecaprenyl-diphosphatase
MDRRPLVAIAGLLGAAAWVRFKVLPTRPDDVALPIPRRIPEPQRRPGTDGTGVRLVVNPAAGPAWSASPADTLREALPGAEVHELGPDDDIASALAGGELLAVGAVGGDGTLAAAATVASERGLPLIAIPAGTLNHLARDLGLNSLDDAVAALAAGTVTHMDLGLAGDRPFVNTLTLGGYSAVVDRRERLEPHLGKWLALAVALVLELPSMEPLHVELDGRPLRLWLGWIGNCRYSPDGFAPAWREELDDGLLDVRLVHGERSFSRARLVLDVLTGRLGSSPVYDQWTVRSVTITSELPTLRLAADGETYDGPPCLHVTKRTAALMVAVPPVSDQQSPSA